MHSAFKMINIINYLLTISQLFSRRADEHGRL